MGQFVWFLGRFHVLVLHLPLGILTLAVAFEIFARFSAFRSLASAVVPLWVAGALTAIATAALGFMHASEDSFRGLQAVEAHRWAGVALTAAACLAAVLRMRPLPAVWRFNAVPAMVVAALMVITGHLGGKLTHGETYLVQYAPAPIRLLAGLPAVAASRPRPSDLGSADIYLDVVQPALASRCSTCHNDAKRSGGLSLASYEALMKGGTEGAVIKPGDPAASDLFRRINLAQESEDFMPKEGKTPLNRGQMVAIGWWIEQGAPKSGAVASLKPTAEASAAIQSILGIAGEADGAAAVVHGESVRPPAPPPDQVVVARVIAGGFSVRNIEQGSSWLDLDYTSPKPLAPEVLAELAKLAPNILRLNLRRAGVSDAEASTIATFRELNQLRLEDNPITDAGAGDLTALTKLTSLNLTNTRITDRGLESLARLPQLRTLYVWGTGVTRQAIDKTRVEHKALQIEAGLSAKDVPRVGKVIPPDF